MLGDVVVRRHRWAHASVIHAANHFDHTKKCCMGSYFYAYVWSCFYNYGAPLGEPPINPNGRIVLCNFTISFTFYFMCAGYVFCFPTT